MRLLDLLLRVHAHWALRHRDRAAVGPTEPVLKDNVYPLW